MSQEKDLTVLSDERLTKMVQEVQSRGFSKKKTPFQIAASFLKHKYNNIDLSSILILADLLQEQGVGMIEKVAPVKMEMPLPFPQRKRGLPIATKGELAEMALEN
jgi:hypothetical protein